MHKRGALELSVNALVVVILAFAMLTLGIFFTNFLRENLEKRALDVFTDVTILETPPTADKPVSFPDLSIKHKGEEMVNAGFYNTLSTQAQQAAFRISKCTGINEPNKLPLIVSLSENVDASTAFGYKLTVKEKGAGTGNYVCKVEVYNADDPTQVYASKQFYLEVKS